MYGSEITPIFALANSNMFIGRIFEIVRNRYKKTENHVTRKLLGMKPTSRHNNDIKGPSDMSV